MFNYYPMDETRDNTTNIELFLKSLNLENHI